MSLPELKITVFSDYICPFCYIGHHRLQHLRDTYDLKINWCFLEIHPEISPAGEPISSLSYAPAQWQQMMAGLHRLAEEENLPLREPDFITNSQAALLLSEAAKQYGRDIFYRLHEALFQAWFVDGKNIGDKDVLTNIATETGINTAIIQTAWTDPACKKRLSDNYQAANRYGISGVPAFIFGDRVLTGVVTEEILRQAADQLYQTL